MCCAKFAYKLIHNKIDCAFLLSKLPFYVPRLASRYEASFQVPTARTNVLQRSPIHVMCKAVDNVYNDVFC